MEATNKPDLDIRIEEGLDEKDAVAFVVAAAAVVVVVDVPYMDFVAWVFL